MPTRLRASGRSSSPSGVVGQGRRVGAGAADLERDRVRIVRQVDAALVRRVGLAHLLRAVPQRHHARGRAQDQRLDHREESNAVVVVELGRDVVGQLEMLALVVAHRHAGRVVGMDVGRHQVRVDVQPGGDGLAVLAGLVLELRHAVQPAEPGHAVEDPGEPGVGVHGGLVEQDRAVVDPCRQQRRRHAAARLCQGGRVLPGGDRVQVDDAEDAVVPVLQRHPVADRAQVVAEGGHAGRLDAGEDALHGRVLPGQAGSGQARGVAGRRRTQPGRSSPHV